MTNSIYFGKMEIDFSHPLSADIIKYASPKIQSNLTRVMEEWYDEETRLNDPRRTHLPLYRTVFRTTYGKDGITITNELPYGGEAPQFSYLYYGNKGKPICAQGFTRHILKGYSANDRHKTVKLKDGTRIPKPKAGDLGVERPRVLKFWSKRDNMWMYRRCVEPIGRGIIISFQQAVKQAVNKAIEDASWEANYESDINEEMGTSDDTSAVTSVGEGEEVVIEDIILGDYGAIHTEKEKQEVENQLMTMASRAGQEVEKKLRFMSVATSKAQMAKAFKPEVQPAPKTGVWASVKHFGVSSAHTIKSFLFGGE